MLRVIAGCRSGRVQCLSAEGHTGFADAGSDIVCAAVSTLMQALRVGLADVLNAENLSAVADPEIPLMTLGWEPTPETEILARTILLSLRGVAAAYPEYVEIVEEY